MNKISRSGLALLLTFSGLLVFGPTGAGCDSPTEVNASCGSAGGPDSGLEGGGVAPSSVVISAGTRTPVAVTRSINYWQWAPTYGDDISGTESKVAPLGFSVMRVGGYNNDANAPDPFDDAQLDKAVAYARAIGAQPLIQVPLLAGPDQMPPTPDTAAAMVTYANVTKNYGLKYFSIGNEPDLYSIQGNLSDSTLPAFPGYLPADYCASARAYVTAMKAVDPTIQIVGPDLSYRYTPNNDFLTPLLTNCGDLFDVIAVHRYVGSSAQASIANVSKDVNKFRSDVGALHALVQAAGYGAKPLAITEMNVDYDALPTGNVPAAACGTVPSALWAADILGASREVNLWTTALWDLADDPGWQLGFLDPPPTHTPRPQYYAYQFYAQHSGPSRLDVTTSPDGVNVYASRNAADDTTQAVVVNWNTHAIPLEFHVTDLTPAPAPATFTLPALAIAAIDIPDGAAASALVYGAAQHDAGSGAATLSQGIGPLDNPDAGTAPDSGKQDAATPPCAQTMSPTPVITSGGVSMSTTAAFGTGAGRWGSYSYAGPGQTPPSGTVTSDGNGIQIAASFVLPLSPSNNYDGFGLYYNSSSCLDASQYTGIQFDISGDLGACLMTLALTFSDDVSTANDPGRGRCMGTGGACLAPEVPVTQTSGTVKVPFTSFAAGKPLAALDPSVIIGIQWQLSGPYATPDGGGGCAASFTVENVSFY